MIEGFNFTCSTSWVWNRLALVLTCALTLKSWGTTYDSDRKGLHILQSGLYVIEVHFFSCGLSTGLSTATIEYSCPSVCLSVCLCVCLCTR